MMAFFNKSTVESCATIYQRQLKYVLIQYAHNRNSDNMPSLRSAGLCLQRVRFDVHFFLQKEYWERDNNIMLGCAMVEAGFTTRRWLLGVFCLTSKWFSLQFIIAGLPVWIAERPRHTTDPTRWAAHNIYIQQLNGHWNKSTVESCATIYQRQ